jgi:hypothetical protein
MLFRRTHRAGEAGSCRLTRTALNLPISFIGAPCEEPGREEMREYLSACLLVESPEPGRFADGHSEAWSLFEFLSDSLHKVYQYDFHRSFSFRLHMKSEHGAEMRRMSEVRPMRDEITGLDRREGSMSDSIVDAAVDEGEWIRAIGIDDDRHSCCVVYPKGRARAPAPSRATATHQR